MRDPLAKVEAAASASAAAAEPDEARRAAAKALLPGKPASKGAMRVYYGQAGSNGVRGSERAVQLRVRQRLARSIRAIIKRHCELGWKKMKRGPADLAILQPLYAQGR